MAGSAWPDARNRNSPLKTTCPSCATLFRVTPEQLAARAGKVRCGKCQEIFNALDQMRDKSAAPEVLPLATTEYAPVSPPASAQEEKLIAFFTTDALESTPDPTITPAPSSSPVGASAGDAVQEEVEEVEPEQVLALASMQAMPRETREIPGYSKWTEGAFNKAPSFHDAKANKWPFTLAAFLFGVTLLGQLAFHFRTAIAVTAPALRPPLEVLCKLLGSDIPLPRQVDLISIETSDLQVDPRQTSLLALQATLRNRAAYEQAYPALQLSLTDTHDSVIVRRVFLPEEYLSAQNMSPLVFAANAEISVRMWIEAKNMTAAGYRLYAFYP